ncbi:RPM1-interacting protein 4-like isoform X3 [Momordica charantia]|uniref:RPM1-interacting protein 4-like isoform X3 n=1 Tax=Momordica charantia TaxID=3673 RepID=A0A6J1CZW4_MOMCH|nr:RPM1-interacting protein 4-like isoform X3 [Momordica charantia]
MAVFFLNLREEIDQKCRKQRSSQVPEFGKWDSGEDVPYTTYFDNATKAKSQRLNPNDPSVHREEISDTVRSNYEQQKIGEGGVVRRQTESPLHRDALELRGRDYDGIKSVKSQGQQPLRPIHVQEDLSPEDGNMKRHPNPPLDRQRTGQVSFNSPLHRRQGNNTTSSSSKRTVGNSTGSDCSIENSPLHPRQHPRTEGKSAVPSSPLREIRGSISPKGGNRDGLAPSTPVRSRQRSATRGNETPDRSATVPKFGDWDESDPTSSENYTNIFTKVREERTGEGSFPAGTNVSHSNSHNRSGAENSKRCCCFPWGK